MWNKKATLSTALLITLLATFTLSCSKKQESVEAASPSKRQGRNGAAPVVVSTVTVQDVPIEIESIGNVEAYQTVQIKSMVGGQIEGVHFAEGEDVRKGQLLYSLDKRPFKAALDQAAANLERDKAQAEHLGIQAKRYSDLEKQGVISKDQADQLISQSQAQNSAVVADEAAVEAAKVQLAYTDIFSPIDGRAGALQINQGNLVRPNDTAFLVSMNQLSPIYASFSIPETRLADIRKYQSSGLKVIALPKGQRGNGSVGKLSFIDNTVDPLTATVKLKATFENKDRKLWPGEFVDVVVQLSVRKGVTVVPTKAVQSGQAGDYVYLISSEKTAVATPVKIDGTYRDLTIISEGLSSGDSVIVEGQVRVVPNGKVLIQGSNANSASISPAASTSGAGQ